LRLRRAALYRRVALCPGVWTFSAELVRVPLVECEAHIVVAQTV
jgi:hypothetical protein